MTKDSCPKCSSGRYWKVRRERLKCVLCKHEWTPDKLPLRLTPVQWQRILRCFLTGMSSNRIPLETRVNKRRVLRALTLAREVMLRDLPDVFRGEFTVDASSPGEPSHGRDRTAARGNGAEGKPLFALYCRGCSIWAEVVPTTAAGTPLSGAVEKIRRKCFAFTGEGKEYPGISAEIYRYQGEERTAKGVNTRTEDLDQFWSYLKRNLISRSGVRREKLSLYLAECVWRYNHRELPLDTQVTLLMKCCTVPCGKSLQRPGAASSMNTEKRCIQMKYAKSMLLVCIIFTIVTGCATPPPKVEQSTLFFPPPPELPRIHYLTSFTGSKDIVAERSAFDTFITGEKDRGKRLDKPYGAALYNGKIYVCDTNATVIVFDLVKKTYAPLQGAQGMGKLVQPINISIDREGNKYVTDPVRGQVVIFDKNDFYVKAIGMPGEWKPVDAAPYEDRLYVVDIKNSEIKVFDKSSGELLQRIGQKGDPSGWLVQPTNIAFDKQGYLYVSDAGRFQIVKFDRDGHLKGTIGKLGSNPGFFARPRGIAVDRENRLFAVDAAFDNVQIFKEDQLLLFFGHAGNKPGDFYLPAKVSIDYDNIELFRQYAQPTFDIEAIILVTNQFGDRMVNVFAFGKEKGKKYPSDSDIVRQIEEKIRKMKQEQPEEQKETKEAKKEK